MSRPIAYNASGPLSGSIRGANVNYIVDSGDRNFATFGGKKWVPSADGAAPIVFVTDTFTQGFQGDPSLAVPLFYSCNGTGSAAIIYTANRIPSSPGNYSDANVALNDLITARGYFILESNDPFQGIDADSLALSLDASKMSSYPQVSTSWRDLSGNGNTGVLTNGPTWNSNGWFQFDGVDDHVNFNPIILSGDFSITQTVNLSPRTNGNMPIGGGTANGGSNFLGYIWFLNTANIIFFRVNSEVGPAFSVDSSKWLNKNITYTVTRNGTTGKLYINGTEEGLQFIPTNNFDIRTIGYSYNFVYTCDGNISTTQIYNKALTQTEVKQNYFGAPIVTDGLVFAVDANNLVSYPKSGTAVYNLTGSSNNGTLINGTGFNNSNGGTWVFDGTDDGINIGNLTPTSGVTFYAWIRLEGGNTNYGAIFTNWGSSADAFFIGTYPSQNYIQVYFVGNLIFEITNLPFNTWMLLTVTNNGSSIQAYINGNLTNTANGTLTSANGITSIGYDINRNNYPFKGNIANAKIYNRGLTAAEVLQNYQAEQYRFEEPLNIPTFGLQAYWDASNLESYSGGGTTWTDTVSGNTMTWSSPAPQWNINQFTTTPLLGFLRPMISTGYINGRTGGGAYSVAAIFKPLSLGANQILFSMGPADSSCSGQNIHPVAINSAGRFGGGACGGLGTWTTGGGVIPTTTKYYCVVTTFSGGTGTETVYVDGVFDKSAAMSTDTPVSAANRYGYGWIRDDGAAYGMDAQLGVVMYYNRELTATEVTQIYNAYKDDYGL